MNELPGGSSQAKSVWRLTLLESEQVMYRAKQTETSRALVQPEENEAGDFLPHWGGGQRNELNWNLLETKGITSLLTSSKQPKTSLCLSLSL